MRRYKPWAPRVECDALWLWLWLWWLGHSVFALALAKRSKRNRQPERLPPSGGFRFLVFMLQEAVQGVVDPFPVERKDFPEHAFLSKPELFGDSF